MAPAKIPSDKSDPRNVELLARRLNQLLVKDPVELLHNHPRDLWAGFVRGIVFGLGSVIGATVMVAVLLFMLQQLGALPLIGEFFDNLGETIRR